MEKRKIFLVLTLFMGVSLANDDPGLFRDKTTPKKWSFFEKRKEPEHDTKRYRMPQKVAIAEFDDIDREPYCQSKRVNKPLNSKKTKYFQYLPERDVVETVCDLGGVDDSDINVLDGDDLQYCFEKHKNSYYCSTVKGKVPVLYKCVGCPPWIPPRIYYETVGVACQCRHY